ncbi:GIY-YIG nuclease family protein [Synechococcus sp. MU1655]|uniref:GIY-YIG nuclease family protein n=1 Tax=Synechococcus sp. MU1655 TaxID=2508355 RepID=UPI00202741B7|nr:GIY-YIG nuclease family protein [Synechococcus sp. MU1655]
MGFVILILVALVVWYYFKSKDLEKQTRSAQRTANQLKEERTRAQRLAAAAQRKRPEEDLTLSSFNHKPSPSEKQPSPPKKTAAIPKEESQPSTSRKQAEQSLNTGIAELDGPGMFQRLTRLGESASAVYLLYSKQHDAYKVGYCDPMGIAKRINQIKPEVPDVKLDGTQVFTTVQNAFNAEQRILDKYKSYKYNGINGRWSGSTEWITQRPTGRPYLMEPTKVEARYQEELEAEPERPSEQDIYTVYLMKSQSKGMHKVSWCKTENLMKKLRVARNDFANDVEIISRFPIQTLEKARAVAIDINEKAGTFKKEGRKESYIWTSNPSYLNKFKDYGPDAKKTP